MELNIIWYIVFLSILFIIYFISTLLRKNLPTTHKPSTTIHEPAIIDEPPTTHDPDWWDIREKNIKEEVNIIKFCEYCGEKSDERGGKYCHLCGTGFEELMK